MLKKYHSQAATLRLEEYFDRKPTKLREEFEETFSELFSHSALESLQAAAGNGPNLNETAKSALKTLRSIVELGFLSKRTAAVSSELGKCRDSVRIVFNNEVLELENTQGRLRSEPDAVARREIHRRVADAERVCSRLRKEKVRQIQACAQELGFPGLAALFEGISAVDFLDLAGKCKGFLDATEARYFDLLRVVAVDAGLDPSGLGCADLHFLREKLEHPLFFPGGRLSRYYEHLLDNFGFSAGDIPQIILKRVSGRKPTTNFQTYFPRAGFLCVSSRDGVENHREFLRAFGRAQMGAWASEKLFEEYPEFVFAPDDALCGGYGVLFQSLLADKGFVSRNLFLREEGLERKLIVEETFRALFEARRQILLLLAEIEVYSAEPGDLDEIGRVFAEEFGKTLGFECADDQMIKDISRDFSAQRNLRSMIFGCGLLYYLRERHDLEWWKKRACFEELIDLWNTSARYGAEEMAGLVGFEASLDHLAESIIANSH